MEAQLTTRAAHREEVQLTTRAANRQEVPDRWEFNLLRGRPAFEAINGLNDVVLKILANPELAAGMSEVRH